VTESRLISKVMDESDSRFRYDNDVEVEDILNAAEDEDLSDARMLINPDKSPHDIIYLKLGDKERGEIHYLRRCILGKERKVGNNGQPTSICPLGQKVGQRKITESMDFEDVRELVFKIVKKETTIAVTVFTHLIRSMFQVFLRCV
jgi:hypothetical protein